MAISSSGVGYKFLPPIILDNPNTMSGKSGGSTTGTAAVSGTTPAPAIPAPDKAVEQASTGKHLLRITV